MTDKAVDSFLALASTRLAPKTVEAYRRDLADAADFLKASPASATPQRLAEYVAGLRARGLAATTIARRIAALRSFYRHQLLIGVRTDNPAAELELPRRPRTLPRTLSLEPREEALHLCRPRRVRQATRGAWGECGVRHARRPEGVTQEGAHGGELAADRRRGELGRPPAGTRGAQVRCIVDERADVDVVELRLAPLQPAAELVDVVAIGTPRALRERRRVEKACSGRVGVHGPEFDTRPAQPAPEPAVLAR